MKPDEEFGQIFIDEAQDFGVSIYYVFKKVLPKCFFAIMGDVSQNVNYEFGLNSWKDMTQKNFNDGTDEFRLLSKSYRNTIEISNFAGEILDQASHGTYKIDPVIRHSKPVELISSASDSESIMKIRLLLKKIYKNNFETISILCFDDINASHVFSLLTENNIISSEYRTQLEGSTKRIKVLTVKETKGLEFDCVILWKPDMYGYKNNPKLAKQMYVAATRALHELYIINNY